jgi:4-hydroxy-tetrahydrodipicolinate synthase
MELQDKLIPLREFFSQGTFPVTVKEAMMLQGLPSGPCRRPVGPISEEKREILRGILRNMGLL